MNITSPILTGVIRAAEWGDSVSSLLRVVGASTGRFDDSPDGGLADGIVVAKGATTPEAHDAFAIRYRVL